MKNEMNDDAAVIAIANIFGVLEAEAEMLWDTLDDWRKPIFFDALEKMHWQNNPNPEPDDDE